MPPDGPLLSPRGKSSCRSGGCLLIKVRGTVQGVGFRPFVYGLAAACGLKGFVSNTSEGVTIEAEGGETGEFLRRLREEAPPLARITAVEVSHLPPAGYAEFRIVQSEEAGSFTLVSPDVCTCGDCLSEMRNPAERRYRYPFINCTNCGPRYTITRGVPYDRPNTTMSVFAMCPDCRREYEDPANRRFHAVPNACPACGPRVTLLIDGAETRGPDPVAEAADLLKKGEVVAVKGLGGFHLACDATNARAVMRLRERKRKNSKPFALMAPDVETMRKYCHVSDDEEALLNSNRRPVVLLRKKAPCGLPEAVSPGNRKIGFMLPYTPLHWLLTERFDALVMTSGNRSEEPIQVDNQEAVEALRGIARAFLLHDRGIFMRVDDTVMKLSEVGAPRFIRKARGYTPEPVPLHEDGPDVLGAGADLKTTFTLMKGPHAIVSQHLGDMENHETQRFYDEVFHNIASVYRAEPVSMAYDLHPGYFSTRWAIRRAKDLGIRALAVQHHHAHVASVMAEEGLRGKVIGVALDGTGYGTDGTLWGGEFLIADPLGFERAGHFSTTPLPGGEQAVREPWRAAVSFLRNAAGDKAVEYLRRLGYYEKFGERNVNNVLTVCGLRDFSPLTSGAGRLFDAVSSILDICHRNTFEGEAAMALEAGAADEADRVYPVTVHNNSPLEVDFSPALISLVDDVLSGTAGDVVAARFQHTVAEAVSATVEKLSSHSGITTVVLSGGVFQNDCLLSGVTGRLGKKGLTVHANRLVPANDAGISLGQAYVLREYLKRQNR